MPVTGLRLFAVILLTLIAPFAHAGINKCVKNGETVYQQLPCADGAAATKVITSDANALPWSSLKSGMDVETVRQRIPKTRQGSNDRLFNGARELLAVDSFTVAGLTLFAKFYFDEVGFLRVNCSGPMSVNNARNAADFEKVFAEFRRRYGEETVRKDRTNIHGLSLGAEWEHATGKTWISVLPITAETSWLSVGFVPKR